MDIQELNTQIEYLNETKGLLRQAIINKGQSIGINDTFRSYVDKVNSITNINLQSKSVTPTTSQILVEPDAQHNGLSSVTIAAVTNTIDPNIISSNIKNGISILGIQGSSNVVDTSNADASENDIAYGRKAYVNGQLVTGNVSTYSGTIAGSEGTNLSLGSNEIYFNITHPQNELYRANTITQNWIDNSSIISAIGLTANKIKLGETILGVTGTYSDAMKSYVSVAAMNNDIANISMGEVVKVIDASTTYYIKDTTMVKLVKETETLTPEEYDGAVDISEDILGE